MTRRLFDPLNLCAGAMAIAGIMYGFDVSVMAGAILYLDADFDLTESSEEWVVSSILLGATLGALVGGVIADRFGRRTAMIVVAASAVAGVAIIAASPGVGMLVVGRLVQGFAVGAVSVCGPLYLAEIAPNHIRGLLVGLYSFGIQVGVLLGYVIGLALADSGDWRLMMGFGILPALILAIAVPFLPETPRWLLQRNHPQKARRVLAHLRGSDAVDGEIQAMEQQIAQQSSRWADLLAPGIAMIMLVGIGLAVFREITGFAIATLYSPTLLAQAGHEPDRVDILASVGVGSMFVAAAVVAMLLVDRLGRRPMLLTGVAIMTASIGALGLAFALLPVSPLLAWIAVACLAACAAGFSLGPGPVVFLLIAEIYPRRIRARAMGVAMLALWLSFWLNARLFLSSVEALGTAGALWLHAGFGVAALAFIYLAVPETKGRGLEEIEAEHAAH